MSVCGATTRSRMISRRSVTPWGYRPGANRSECIPSTTRRSKLPRTRRSACNARYGEHVELLFLGTHGSTATQTSRPDSPDRPKTMLRPRAAHLTEGEPRGVRCNLEGGRIERSHVDTGRLPGRERSRRVGDPRPDDELRAGASRRHLPDPGLRFADASITKRGHSGRSVTSRSPTALPPAGGA
jgi:hypothetical protein